ncbi:MAG: hypothetical protein HYZ58_02130 [Acidobacteria bacterium]|nr:hypothetical protein [Acidobacteriota bacterium]
MLAATLATQTPPHGFQPDIDILQRFLTRAEPPLARYLAARRLEARNDRFKATGWLEACTELSPETGFQYRVMAEHGNGLIRKRVLKRALETEREARAKGETDRSSIGAENYDFRVSEESDGELVKVLIKARRRSSLLVDGAMFLSRSDGDLVRVEGQLAASPSLWTRRATIVRRYERVAGVRVPVSLESTAEVRLARPSSFRMIYHYFSINGQDLPEGGAPCAVRPG